MTTLDPERVARHRRAAALLTLLGSTTLVAVTVGGGLLTAAASVWLAQNEVPGPWREVFDGVLVTGCGLAVAQALFGSAVAWIVWSSDRPPIAVWGDLSALLFGVVPITAGCFLMPFGPWAGANAAFGLGGAWLAWREQRSMLRPLEILAITAVGFGPIAASQWLHTFAHSMTVPLMFGAVCGTMGLQLAVAQILTTFSRHLPLVVLRPSALGRHEVACRRLDALGAWFPEIERHAPEILHRAGRSDEVLWRLSRFLEHPRTPAVEAAARIDRAWVLVETGRTDPGPELARIEALGGDRSALDAILAIHRGTVDDAHLATLARRIADPPPLTFRLAGVDRRPELRADLAWALAVAGRADAARVALDEILTSPEPSSARVLWRLGATAATLGDPGLAHHLWERGAARDPGQAGHQCRLRVGRGSREPEVGTGAVATA